MYLNISLGKVEFCEKKSDQIVFIMSLTHSSSLFLYPLKTSETIDIKWFRDEMVEKRNQRTSKFRIFVCNPLWAGHELRWHVE